MRLEISISISSRPCWYLQVFKKYSIFKYDWCLHSLLLALSHYNQGNKTLALNTTQINHFLRVTGILTVLPNAAILNVPFESLYSTPKFRCSFCIRDISWYTITLDYKNLEITGYNILRADNASNSKRGGVYLSYKSSFALGVIDVHYLQECLIFGILVGWKLWNFISLFRSPSQSSDSFEEFAESLNSHWIKLVIKTDSLQMFWVISILNLQIGLGTIKQHAKAPKLML